MSPAGTFVSQKKGKSKKRRDKMSSSIERPGDYLVDPHNKPPSSPFLRKFEKQHNPSTSNSAFASYSKHSLM